MLNNEKPEKIYVFIMDSEEKERTPQLRKFMEEYEARYHHFYNTFGHIDSLKLEFLLQIEPYIQSQLGANVVTTRQGQIYVENELIADFGNLPFASNNQGYQKRLSELERLREEITLMDMELGDKRLKLMKWRRKVEDRPSDTDFREVCQSVERDVNNLINTLHERITKKNKLEKEFEYEQQFLLQTARRITEMRGQKSSERVRHAADAFNQGDARRADFILNETVKEADVVLSDLKANKEEAIRLKIVSCQLIEELCLKASEK